MKRLLLIIVAALSLQTAQLVMALGDIRDFPLHKKYEGTAFTMGSPLEQLLDIILMDDNGKNTLYPGTTLSEEDRREDSFGNCHVTYVQQQDGYNSNYQLVLHFHPDGQLYYLNGMLAVESGAAGAKAVRPTQKIAAEQAATVATGSPLSQAKPMLVSHNGCPREAYEVLDSKTLCHVYVDAYSGEVLFNVPLLHSYAAWDEQNGTSVTLPAMTSYNGLQDIQLMQTEDGYILRDPERRILTIDCSNKFDDYKESDYPRELSEQEALLAQKGVDFLFADKEQLLDAKYTTAINSIDFNIWDLGNRPKKANIHIYYIDDDGQPAGDLLNVDIDDIAWVKDSYLLSFTYKPETAIDVDLYSSHNNVDITLDDNFFSGKDIILPGNKQYKSMSNVNNEWISCLVGVDVCASKPAIDVHWGVQQTYDMYRDYFGYNGSDNKGSQIINVVNPPNNMTFTEGLPENAQALPDAFSDHYGNNSYMMLYGMGTPHLSYPYTSLATLAHEYTHNVVAGSGKMLIYINESGALNEAMADCMSQVAMQYVTGKPSWQDKEMSVQYDNYRNFSDPWYSGSINGNITSYYAQPKYYGGRFWVDYTTDRRDSGGVHINSGVFNHLFYLLCEGAMGATNEKGETRDIHPIGMDRMKDILFHSIRYYNSALCTYAEIADNLMMVVEDINGQNSDTSLDIQKKMQDAYSHVGMTTSFTPTGISTVSNPPADSNAASFNIAGQRVSANTKGIIIRNGVKIVNK